VVEGYALALDFLQSLVLGILGGIVGYVLWWAITTGCEISKWDWWMFAESVAIGAAAGVVVGGVFHWLGLGKVFAKLPPWMRW